MAYEGVSNYCHSAYDWSMAEANPSMMYVEMGEEYATSNTGWAVLRQLKEILRLRNKTDSDSI